MKEKILKLLDDDHALCRFTELLLQQIDNDDEPLRDFSADGFREACCIREYMMWSVVFSVSIEYISFDLQIYNLFPNSPTPHRFSFTPSSVAPSHRRTVAFIAIACRENQYCKIRRRLYRQYKILIINILLIL